MARDQGQLYISRTPLRPGEVLHRCSACSGLGRAQGSRRCPSSLSPCLPDQLGLDGSHTAWTGLRVVFNLRFLTLSSNNI